MPRNDSHLVDLASLCPAWSGWALNTKTGDLWPPDGDRPHRPELLLQLHWYFQELAAERAELRQQVTALSAQLEAVRRTPTHYCARLPRHIALRSALRASRSSFVG